MSSRPDFIELEAARANLDERRAVLVDALSGPLSGPIGVHLLRAAAGVAPDLFTLQL